MRKLPILIFAAALAVVALLAVVLWPRSDEQALRVGIAPYQDLAMIVNIEPLGLEKRYGTDVDLVTLPWEEIVPSVATAGRGLDVGFASYSEYLAKYKNLNEGSSDPVLFVYPLYVFKGGAFVTFRKDVPRLTQENVKDRDIVSRVLGLRIGAQTRSLYELMVYRLAKLNGVDVASIKLIDTPLDQGFLAAQQGSLDLASAGLTQITEAQRRGGRVVLTMDDLRFADFTGFIVKRSTLEARGEDIRNLIRMWFDCVDYVYMDLDRNSTASRAYLDQKASTRYTLDEYKRALSQEFLPRSIAEAASEFIEDDGKFPVRDIKATNIDYLVGRGVIDRSQEIPEFIKP